MLVHGPRGRVCTVVIEMLTIEAHLSMQYIDGDCDEPGGDGRYELLIVQVNGDFDLVYVISTTRALNTKLELPDGSYVWC